MNQDELEKIKQEAWDKFYYTKEAQSFCFGNHNNATRDEQVGEFSFNGGFDCGVEALQKELDEAMSLIAEIKSQAKLRGYPTASEWIDLIGKVNEFLAKVKKE